MIQEKLADCASQEPWIEYFASISAFAPISNPSQVPWDRKRSVLIWVRQKWAVTYLFQYSEQVPPILMTQGSADNFYDVQVNEVAFLEEGYDYGYFTIATFIGEHIQFHMEALNKQ